MSTSASATWSEQIERTLQRYDEPLLRRVSEKMIRPRNQWPAGELVNRDVAAVGNAAAVDRWLRDLEPASRRLLALIGHSRQPHWRVGSLVEMLAMLGPAADTRPILGLLQAGLLYPVLPDNLTRLKSFEHWLGTAHTSGPEVFAPPDVTARALGEDLGLPACPVACVAAAGARECDGLEWPLRLMVAWQQVSEGPLRRTQSGEFFKRDIERLRTHPILSTAPADQLTDLPDAGLLAIELGLALGLLRESNGEITAAPLPERWERGLPTTLADLWSAWPHLLGWNPLQGWEARQPTGSPFQSAGLLAVLLLAQLPKDGWADPRAVARWIVERQPFWSATGSCLDRNGDPFAAPSDGLARFLLGVAFDWKLLQAATSEQGETVIRLSPYGRWLLGLGAVPAIPQPYNQTLLVQPNLEIVAYRQGLTPALVARLSRFAVWKSLGSACTLQLQPDSVYRALEAGETFESIRRTLDQHGMRPTPPTVIESLRTWSNKRERLSVYPSATLFEFASTEDMNDALARGLPAMPVSDRLAVVANESDIDFRHFRLTGTRDYVLPPEQCIDVADDGVTLIVDLTKSDLMLETELQRFAEIDAAAEKNGRRRFVLTPASLSRARDQGVDLATLEEWFLQRTGQGPSPAVRLLLNGAETAPPKLQRRLVLHVSEPEIADGLWQWPSTRELLQARLGPKALAVAEEHVEELRNRLKLLGIDSGEIIDRR